MASDATFLDHVKCLVKHKWGGWKPCSAESHSDRAGYAFRTCKRCRCQMFKPFEEIWEREQFLSLMTDETCMYHFEPLVPGLYYDQGKSSMIKYLVENPKGYQLKIFYLAVLKRLSKPEGVSETTSPLRTLEDKNDVFYICSGCKDHLESELRSMPSTFDEQFIQDLSTLKDFAFVTYGENPSCCGACREFGCNCEGGIAIQLSRRIVDCGGLREISKQHLKSA